MAKVIHVHFFTAPPGTKKDYYFSSISAVLTVLTPQQLGISASYIHHLGLGGNGTYTNTRCIIRQADLISTIQKKRSS